MRTANSAVGAIAGTFDRTADRGSDEAARNGTVVPSLAAVGAPGDATVPIAAAVVVERGHKVLWSVGILGDRRLVLRLTTALHCAVDRGRGCPLSRWAGVVPLWRFLLQRHLRPAQRSNVLGINGRGALSASAPKHHPGASA